jgi:hypothetical protein
METKTLEKTIETVSPAMISTADKSAQDAFYSLNDLLCFLQICHAVGHGQAPEQEFKFSPMDAVPIRPGISGRIEGLADEWLMLAGIVPSAGLPIADVLEAVAKHLRENPVPPFAPNIISGDAGLALFLRLALAHYAVSVDSLSRGDKAVRNG